MEDIKVFFDLIYAEGIELDRLDAIHALARQIARNEYSPQCEAFEEWYAENVYNDED